MAIITPRRHIETAMLATVRRVQRRLRDAFLRINGRKRSMYLPVYPGKRLGVQIEAGPTLSGGRNDFTGTNRQFHRRNHGERNSCPHSVAPPGASQTLYTAPQMPHRCPVLPTSLRNRTLCLVFPGPPSQLL